MKAPIRRVHTGDRTLDEAQRTAQDAAAKLNALPFSNGVYLTAEEGKPAYTGLQFTASTARSIKHGLGRKAMGFMELYGVDLTSAARVGLFPTAAPSGVSSATHITVTPTSTGSCFLFVF